MMRYTSFLLVLVMACGQSVAENLDEVAAEVPNEVEVLVINRALENVIVRVCPSQTCRRVVFVAAGKQERGSFTYDTDVNLVLEVQYVGRDPGLWRSESLYWITPGICIEVDVRPYDTRRSNSVGRCTG